MCKTIEEIERFQRDRELDKQSYNDTNELTNIFEELGEILGYPNIDREYLMDLVHRFERDIEGTKYKEPTNEDKVDGYADIIVFCIGAMMKLGYDPKVVLEEVGKEINSRAGQMLNGKFTKYKSPEAVAKWYKADFTKAKLRD